MKIGIRSRNCLNFINSKIPKIIFVFAPSSQNPRLIESGKAKGLNYSLALFTIKSNINHIQPFPIADSIPYLR